MYDSQHRILFLGGLLLILLALGLTAGWLLRKPGPSIYGAIALSQRSQRFGVAWGYADPKAAAHRAEAECAETGLADCAVRVNLAGRCAALVMSAATRRTFAVTDLDKNSAGALALAQCQASGASDCAVQASFCGAGAVRQSRTK